MLMARAKPLNGAIDVNVATKSSTTALNAACSMSRNPSARMTMLKAPLRGALPNACVVPSTAPSLALISVFPGCASEVALLT
jgi:hypothetical protein